MIDDGCKRFMMVRLVIVNEGDQWYFMIDDFVFVLKMLVDNDGLFSMMVVDND